MKKNNNIYIEAIPYPDLRGMDLRGEGSLAYLENMYVDHDGSADAIESIPGYRSVVRMKEKIHSFCLIGVGETESLVIHSGSRLYIGRTNVVDKDISLSEIARLKDSESSAITLGDICLITDDERMLSVDRHGNVREVNGDERITSCSCATLYDGRIFLSGSKDHRGYLFISNTLGDGEIRFEESLKTACDGEILSLISADGYLIIFHKDGVICHKADGGNPRSYPVVKVIDNKSLCSGAIRLGRELLFMTDDGLTSLKIPDEESEPELCCRSEKINPMLLREDQSKAMLGIWKGYLAICYGERIYLADPRGKEGYDWYFINGVGGFINDRRVYRYRAEAEGCCSLHHTPEEIATGEIYSYGEKDGSLIYYSVEGDRRYSVYPTAELSGGEFCPAESLVCHGGLMWFSSEGSLYLFNSDKRGLCAENEESSFSEVDPLYYSFAGHRVRYALLTKPRKSPVTRERGRIGSYLLLRLKGLSKGELKLIDITDGKAASERKIKLGSLTSVTEREEKIPIPASDLLTLKLPDRALPGEKIQLCLLAEGFASPIGISSIEYRRDDTPKAKSKGKK